MFWDNVLSFFGFMAYPQVYQLQGFVAVKSNDSAHQRTGRFADFVNDIVSGRDRHA